MNREFKLAGLGIRSFAAIFDCVLVFALQIGYAATWGQPGDGPLDFRVTGGPAFLLILLTALYWVVPETFMGKTIGKWMCNIKVVSANGYKCTAGQVWKRNLMRVVDFCPFYLTGFLAAKFSPRRQRLGDQWAETIVIEDKPSIETSSIPAPPA